MAISLLGMAEPKRSGNVESSLDYVVLQDLTPFFSTTTLLGRPGCQCLVRCVSGLTGRCMPVYAYCLMDNHHHLLVQTPRKRGQVLRHHI